MTAYPPTLDDLTPEQVEAYNTLVRAVRLGTSEQVANVLRSRVLSDKQASWAFLPNAEEVQP